MGGFIWLYPSRWHRSHSYRKCHLVTRYGLSSIVRPRNCRDGGDCPLCKPLFSKVRKQKWLMTTLICSRLPSSFEMMATLKASPTACLRPHSSLPGWHRHQRVGTAVISLTTITEPQFAHLEWLQRQQKPHEVYWEYQTSQRVPSDLVNWTGVECLYVLRRRQLDRKVWRPAMAVSYVHQTRVQHDYCQLVATYLVGKRTDSHSRLQNSLPNCPENTFPKAAWLGFTATKTHWPINNRIQKVALTSDSINSLDYSNSRQWQRPLL